MRFITEFGAEPPLSAPVPGWIFHRIEEWVRRYPERPAFTLDDQDRTQQYRYADVLKESATVAAALGSIGIGRGDRVGILMENTPQWVFVLLGAMRLGAITVPLATTLPEPALAIIGRHAGCKVIHTDDTNLEKARAVGAAIGCSIATREESSRTTADVFMFAPVSGKDTALLIYTSGTTGNPKGVELTFDNLNYEIQGTLEILEMSADHRILSVLPFSHVLPLIANALGPLCMGAEVVFLSSVSPQRIIEAFHRHRITFFICVPQFFYILHKRIFAQATAQNALTKIMFRILMAISAQLNSVSVRRKIFAKVHRAIGPDLRFLASGGSRFDPQVAEDLTLLGYVVLQAYGLTETSAAATATPVKANRLGTVGQPIRGVTIRIDSPSEEGIGEVWIRGPIVMKGYYGNEEQTSEAITDGWFRTGDLGFIYADGNLTITGRSKDVIVLANGKNIYPEELETHYSQSPFIKEICIFGAAAGANEPEGETLHAIVVPDMDEFRKRGQTTITEMIRFEIENLSKQLPSYQRILSLSIRNEPLPRTVTRKLKRFEIRKEEKERRQISPEATAGADDPRFSSGVGAAVAALVRANKPGTGALNLAMNLELDLGFDSLARVELLSLLEARLGAHLDEKQAARIFTLGELLDALDTAQKSETGSGRSWKEILEVPPSDPIHNHPIFHPRRIVTRVGLLILRLLRLLARFFFRLQYHGLENIPTAFPFLLCPNHASFLDGPLLASILPRRVLYNLFVLGYSDYWEGAISKRIAEACNIVAIDPNANLIRAMQVGAVGLKHNRALLIFPEGTRSITGTVAEFKKGAAILAFEMGVPIVPVGIRGTFESWPRGGSFRFHPVQIHFGKPIDPRAFSQAPDPYTAITAALRERVKQLTAAN
jgi:long-chain acyl-CoA synthetase